MAREHGWHTILMHVHTYSPKLIVPFFSTSNNWNANRLTASGVHNRPSNERNSANEISLRGNSGEGESGEGGGRRVRGEWSKSEDQFHVTSSKAVNSTFVVCLMWLQLYDFKSKTPHGTQYRLRKPEQLALPLSPTSPPHPPSPSPHPPLLEMRENTGISLGMRSTFKALGWSTIMEE